MRAEVMVGSKMAKLQAISAQRKRIRGISDVARTGKERACLHDGTKSEWAEGSPVESWSRNAG